MCRREPFHIDERRPPSAKAPSGMMPDNIVLAIPYNRNGAQTPVKRCKSSNLGMACDYTASGLTLAFAASDLPQFTKSYYSVRGPRHRVEDGAFLPCGRDARYSAPSIGNANTIVQIGRAHV